MHYSDLNDNNDHTIKVVMSPGLSAEAKQVVAALRERPDDPESSKRAVRLLQEAVDVNLQFFFIQPAKDLGIGSISMKILTVGVNTVVKVIPSVGNKLSSRLSTEQKAKIADFVEKNLVFHDSSAPA